jgi:hypothetical protein
VLQPILGYVAVNEGVGGDTGKAENEEKPQRDRSEDRE